MGVVFTLYLLYLLDRKIEWKNAMTIGVLFALLGYGYFSLMPMYGSLLLGLFIVKPDARFKILVCAIASVLLLAPWLAGFGGVVSNACMLSSEDAVAVALGWSYVLVNFLPSIITAIFVFLMFRGQLLFVAPWFAFLLVHLLNLSSRVSLKTVP